jgi:trehalose 6-phosphate phosphatase
VSTAPRGRFPSIEALAAEPARAGVFLDFDGTLAPIATRPQDVVPAPGATEVLMALAGRFGVVAVITGRPTADIAERVGVPGIRYVGLYGLESGPARFDPEPLREPLRALAEGVPGAWVEPKGLSLAVHYRLADDPGAAREVLAATLPSLVAGTGFELIEGKKVFEVVPAGESRKGGALRRLVAETGAEAGLYAGDDLADLEAFTALDALSGTGFLGTKVAVGGPEAPPELLRAADLTVEGPPGLVELLASLV